MSNLVYGIVMVVHVLIAIFLIVVILIQGGRGGLGEALGGAAAQSLFGGGANTVMTKITAVCAGFFMVTCLSLALLSTARGRSVMDQIPVTSDALPITLPGSPDNLPVTKDKAADNGSSSGASRDNSTQPNVPVVPATGSDDKPSVNTSP